MVLMKIFNTISSKILVIASQKLVSRIALPYKSIHNNRDIFYDEMALIFFMNTIAKRHVERLTVAFLRVENNQLRNTTSSMYLPHG